VFFRIVSVGGAPFVVKRTRRSPFSANRLGVAGELKASFESSMPTFFAVVNRAHAQRICQQSACKFRMALLLICS
jgi:hypothetical protein